MGVAPERPTPRPRPENTNPREDSTSVADLKSVITEAGRTPPEWYDATPLDYPQTLDLSWPQKPPGGWNNQKNVGQYIWDVINPNPGRWRSGVRFMHHMLSVHKDDPTMRQCVMNELGRMYCELLQDYARAAFWYEQAGVGKGSPFDKGKNGAHLAECYWRLGNRKMAVDLMNKLPLTFALIKLWGTSAKRRSVCNSPWDRSGTRVSPPCTTWLSATPIVWRANTRRPSWPIRSPSRRPTNPRKSKTTSSSNARKQASPPCKPSPGSI